MSWGRRGRALLTVLLLCGAGGLSTKDRQLPRFSVKQCSWGRAGRYYLIFLWSWVKFQKCHKCPFSKATSQLVLLTEVAVGEASASSLAQHTGSTGSAARASVRACWGSRSATAQGTSKSNVWPDNAVLYARDKAGDNEQNGKPVQQISVLSCKPTGPRATASPTAFQLNLCITHTSACCGSVSLTVHRQIILPLHCLPTEQHVSLIQAGLWKRNLHLCSSDYM